MQTNRYRLSLAVIAAAFLLPTIAGAQEQSPVPSPSVSPKSTLESKPPADTQKRLDLSLMLTDGIHTVQRSRQQLGFSLASDTPVRFAIDRAALKAALRAIAAAFKAEAVDARPVIIHGKFTILPGADARRLNIPTTAEKIVSAVTADPAKRTIRVALDKRSPEVTGKTLTGIAGRLSQFSTIAQGTTERDNNIAVAVDSINGTLLAPGEQFSLNQTVGQRTKARGFEVAHVFVDAKVVNGVGGGVSQVTGTLFNAAALAGLKIIEVNPHSRPVAYLPLGRDATVAYGAKDLKFKNNTPAPVYITYTFLHKRLTAMLWGTAVSGRKITLRPRVQHLSPGKINAQLYRVTRDRGRVVSKERLLNHAYRWKPGEQ